MGERLELCGRIVGTFDGWEPIDDCHSLFYNVIPYSTVTIPAGDWSVDFTKGWITVGDAAKQYDLVTVLSHVARS